MLQALLKGKLTRKEENLEDLLTSNVFGSIEYVPIEDGLLPLLKNCQNKRGEPLFAETPKVKEVHYQFWPWLNEVKNSGCEPKLLKNRIKLIKKRFKSFVFQVSRINFCDS